MSGKQTKNSWGMTSGPEVEGQGRKRSAIAVIVKGDKSSSMLLKNKSYVVKNWG